MKYLCLCYSDEKKEMSQPEYDALMRDVCAYNDALTAEGRLLACERLQSTETATSIRTCNGKLEITDGPFAETKEQLGGFFMIEAADLDEALRLASKLPSTRHGCIEVRPVRDIV